MLDKAYERVNIISNNRPRVFKGDFRDINFQNEKYDVIIATAVLHHLRDDVDWETTFKKLYHLLNENGSVWIFDLVHQNDSALQEYIYKELYGEYLTGLKDQNYRDHVFSYIEKEDSPRPLIYQLGLLEKVGFTQIDVLHKNLCFASFVGFKSNK